jgi:hypothetical protein
MVYRFTIISDEVDNFRREIQIDSEATFLDFHKAILASADYPDDQMTSFFICDGNWEKETEITLEDMGTSSDMDSWIMEETPLEELLEDEKQHLLYIFDPLADRAFFIELSEIITGKSLPEAVCTKSIGDAPQHVLDFDQLMAAQVATTTLDDTFGGDEDFDLDELDPDGFEMGSAEDFENMLY